MTAQQKNAILNMRQRGASYMEIADALGLSVNTVKSYGRRCDRAETTNTAGDDMNHCKQCGAAYPQPPHRKLKLFCSDACRSKWWNQNKAMMGTARLASCPGCGVDFMAVPSQKYCCRACYFQSRYGGGRHVEIPV